MTNIFIDQTIINPRCRRRHKPKPVSTQSLQSPVLANGTLTAFPLPLVDIYGIPANVIIGRSNGTAGTGGGASPVFQLVPVVPVAGPSLSFTISGSPGAYVANFNSPPTVLAGQTTSVLTFNISTPIDIR